MRSNPFLSSADRDGLPKKIYSDFTKNDDIVEFKEISTVRITGKKDTDFVIDKKVVEVSRTPRTEYINSFRGDVGIMNILQKMALSNDVSLLNQTNRVGYGASGEVDALGRDLEPVVDVTGYQVDRIDALENIKAVKQTAKDGLPADLTDGLGFEGLANLTDEKIDAYLNDLKAKIIASKTEAEKGE